MHLMASMLFLLLITTVLSSVSEYWIMTIELDSKKKGHRQDNFSAYCVCQPAERGLDKPVRRGAAVEAVVMLYPKRLLRRIAPLHSLSAAGSIFCTLFHRLCSQELNKRSKLRHTY